MNDNYNPKDVYPFWNRCYQDRTKQQKVQVVYPDAHIRKPNDELYEIWAEVEPNRQEVIGFSINPEFAWEDAWDGVESELLTNYQEISQSVQQLKDYLVTADNVPGNISCLCYQLQDLLKLKNTP